jgi:hypothetical protein
MTQNGQSFSAQAANLSPRRLRQAEEKAFDRLMDLDAQVGRFEYGVVRQMLDHDGSSALEAHRIRAADAFFHLNALLVPLEQAEGENEKEPNKKP